MLAPYHQSEQLRDEAYAVAREVLSPDFGGTVDDHARLLALAMRMAIVADRVEGREAVRLAMQHRPSRLRCLRRRWLRRLGWRS